MGYTKLANSILTSTIWMEDDQTRIVWMTLLAMADKNGEIQASIPGLANVARVPIESCRAAISIFLSPDPDSRTKTDNGRRIEEIQGGWLLINHSEYRDLSSGDDRKRKAAIRQQRFRDRAKRNAKISPGVTNNPKNATHSAEAEAEAYIRPASAGSSVVKDTTEPATEKALLTFPCNGQVKEWHLNPAMVAKWQEQFPGLVILAECSHALAWVEANGKKTFGGMPKFLVRWLGKSNDSLKSHHNGKPIKTFAQQKIDNMNAVSKQLQAATETVLPRIK